MSEIHMTERMPACFANSMFSPADGFVVREIVHATTQLSARDKEALFFLVAALLHWNRLGSTRLPLHSSDGSLDRIGMAWGWPPGTRRAIDELVLEWRKSTLDNQTAGLRELIGPPGENRPLTCDGDFVYLHRHFVAEKNVAELILAQSKKPGLFAKPTLDLVPRAVESEGATVSTEQQKVIDHALTESLTLLSGGPGSGKTFVVGALCRMFLSHGGAAQHLVLCAPTGKAAQRLAATYARFVPHVATPPRIETLHRLLGYNSRAGSFSFHKWCPLAGELFIVDEASMVGLELWEHFLRALPERSALVLVGDHHQLPSVASGTTFRRLLETLVTHNRHKERVFVLTKNYRAHDSPQGSSLAQLASALIETRSEHISRLMAPKVAVDEWIDSGSVSLFSPTSREQLDHAIRAWWEAQSNLSIDTTPFQLGELRTPSSVDTLRLDALFAKCNQAQVLCVGRVQSRTGSDAINAFLQSVFAEQTHQAPVRSLVPWQPVLVHQNHYALGLWNGDMGIVIAAQEAGAQRTDHYVAFQRGDSFRLIPLHEIQSAIESAFAITVHKSQGSEYGAILLVLPEEDSPLLYRELLYTAITRAKRNVHILGDRELFLLATTRATARHSGLGDRLVECGLASAGSH